MKNFFKNIKNYVTEHKVKTIITVIAVILITILIIIGITATKTETPKVAAEKKITKTVETKKKAPKEEIKKETEVKQEEEVKSTDKTESPAIKEETVNKPSKSTGNTTSKPAVNKPAAKPSTNTSKPATKTSRWVVDRAAWTETKQVPVYDYVYVYIPYATNKATGVQEKFSKFYSYAEVDAYLDSLDNSAYINKGYTNYLEEKLIRTDTQTINHPEEGHWEY